jgi:hypothetical protein
MKPFLQSQDPETEVPIKFEQLSASCGSAYQGRRVIDAASLQLGSLY